ncbi:hypothetical protein Csa_023834, partial [Cucumis sativus]
TGRKRQQLIQEVEAFTGSTTSSKGIIYWIHLLAIISSLGLTLDQSRYGS